MTTTSPVEATDPSVAANPARWFVLAVVCVATYAVLVDTSIVNVALPTLVRELDATTTELKWIVDAYNLAFASLVLVGGSLGDRFGRKTMLLLGLAVFAFGNLVATTMNSPEGLMAMRAVMGVGAALVFPATLSIITNVFTDRAERAKAIGLWGAMTGLGVASAPIIGGWVIEQGSWRWVFAVVVPIAVVAFALAAWRVPQSSDPDTPPLDLGGLGLSIVALAALVTAIIQGPEWGWLGSGTLSLFAVALVVGVAFVAWELRRDQPMLDVSLFANPRFTAASGSVTFAFFALFGFIFLITQYFQFVRGYDPLESGLHTVPFAVGAGITAPIAARLALRFGPRRVIPVGLLFMGVAQLWASTFEVDTSYFGPIILSMMVMASGLSLVTSPASESVMGTLPRDMAGVGSAINDTSREIGGTLGVAIIGSIFASTYGPKIVDLLIPLSLPEAAVSSAKESVGAAFAVAEQVGEPSLAGTIRDAAGASFLDGFQAACTTVGIVALCGSLLALRFLPTRVVKPAEAVSTSV